MSTQVRSFIHTTRLTGIQKCLLYSVNTPKRTLCNLLKEYALISMVECSKFPKSVTLEIQIFKLAGCLQKLIISCLNS